MNQIRQGDLLFLRIPSIPANATVVQDGVIAKGEASGHAHRLQAGSGRLLLMAMGLMYIRAKHEAEITHEEHNTVTLPPGDWRVVRQSEYEPNGWRRVAD